MEALLALSTLYMHIFFHPANPLLEMCPTGRRVQMKVVYAASLKTAKDWKEPTSPCYLNIVN